MFEKEESPAVSLINEEDGEERKLLDNSSENSKKKDPEYPTLTLKQALKLKELYVVAFIFSFSAKSISTYLGYYKVVLDFLSLIFVLLDSISFIF